MMRAFILYFGILTALQAQSTPPHVLRYSGSAPSVAAGKVAATFSLYRGETDATPVWSEQQNVDVNRSGRYTVILGSVSAGGLPADLVSSKDPLWLEALFDAQGAARPARVRLASLNPDAANGTPNYIAMFSSTSDLVSSTIFENFFGSVGIGTAGPNILGVVPQTTVFHVAGAGRFGGGSPDANNDGLIQLAAGAFISSDNWYWNPTFGSNLAVKTLNSSDTYYTPLDGGVGYKAMTLNNSTQNIEFYNSGGQTTAGQTITPASRMVITADGKVGIGTSSPKSTLDVNGSISVNGMPIFQTSAVQSNDFGAGAGALQALTSGTGNTAIGNSALQSNTTGSNNTSLGYQALNGIAAGNRNIAIGNQAGTNLTSGSNDVYIANNGLASESGVIRIGTSGTHNTAFLAGVRGVTPASGSLTQVFIDSNGQLGTVNSSARFKEDIQDMGDSSAKLLQLRPVTYRYKDAYADGSKPIQYGLIAEEVEAVFPDLVARSADGKIETVKYQLLDPMLLNEVQRQNAQIVDQQNRIRSLEERLAKLEAAMHP
jgi:hypothetical protein